MPYAPPSRCSEPGCTAHALRRGRCDEHQRSGWSTGSPRSATDRLGMSGSAWDKIAHAIRRRDDHTCQSCGDPGDEVDHIIPVSEGGAKSDPSNLQTLCSSCHSAKTKRETARANRRRLAARRAAEAVAAERPPF